MNLKILKNECYTPKDFIGPIREFANGFDFDPFSSHLANETVKAKNYCTYEDSAYLLCNRHYWENADTIWCNPEYSTKELTRALDKLFDYLPKRDVFLLLNTDSGTANYQRCLKRCSAVLFPSKRLQFIRPYSLPYTCPEMYAPYAYKPQSNNSAQSLFYLGDRTQDFHKDLSFLGHILTNTWVHK